MMREDGIVAMVGRALRRRVSDAASASCGKLEKSRDLAMGRVKRGLERSDAPRSRFRFVLLIISSSAWYC